MTEKPLSKTMVDTLKWIADNGGVIERLPGGFWVIPGTTNRTHTWAGTSTMDALVRRRKMKWSEWQEPRKGGSRFPIKAEVEA